MPRFPHVRSLLCAVWRMVAVVAAAGLISCEKPPPPSAEQFLPSGKIRVVATTSQLAELTRRIGGDAVYVECVMVPKPPPAPPRKSVSEPPSEVNPAVEEPAKAAPPPVPEAPWNPNPYIWSAKAADIFAMRTSAMLVINGLGLEKGLDNQLEKLRQDGVVVVSVGDGLPPAEVIYPAGPNTPPDPHIWNSPRLWQMAADSVAAGLKSLVPPEAAPYFENRAHEVKVQLTRSSEWAMERLNARPKGDRYIISTHDTLRYFGRDFGIETRAIWKADGQPVEQTDVDLENWLETKGVIVLLSEFAAPGDAVNEVAHRFRLIRGSTIHSLMLARPGTQQLGLLEAFDVGTLDGAFRSMVRNLERKLGGAKRMEVDPATLPDILKDAHK